MAFDGLVAVSMPSYFERPTRITRNMHSRSFRQVHVSATVVRFFPMTVVLWNRLSADSVVLAYQSSCGCAVWRP